MNNLCYEFSNMIFNQYGHLNPTIIIYGSNVYNESSSDLDVCIMLDSKDCQEYKKSIIYSTLYFHKIHNLTIDDEIPHENKLIYSYQDVNYILSHNPFYQNNQYIILDIIKTPEFLSSFEMKSRLLLNILTTDHLTIGNEKLIYMFELKAWKIILESIIQFNHLQNPTVDEVLQCMYTNQYTGAEGEMFLGYKKNYKQKEKYLKLHIQQYLKN